MRGDKKTPTSLKILRVGAKQAEKLLKKQTPTPGALVEPPGWFTAEQKQAWKYAIENAPRAVLRRIDKAVLAGFIIAEDTHRRAAEEMATKALVDQGPTHKIARQNPYLQIVNRQYMLMMRGASELGFTPCSRARIDAGAAPVVSQGDWEDIATG